MDHRTKESRLLDGLLLTAGLFVIVVLGAIAYFGGFSIFRYLGYIRVELLRSNLLKSKSVADYLEHTVPAPAPAARAKALKYFSLI